MFTRFSGILSLGLLMLVLVFSGCRQDAPLPKELESARTLKGSDCVARADAYAKSLRTAGYEATVMVIDPQLGRKSQAHAIVKVSAYVDPTMGTWDWTIGQTVNGKSAAVAPWDDPNVILYKPQQ